MYEVLLDGNTLYYPSNKDYAILNTDLGLDVGLAGEFNFDIPANNPLYNSVGQGCLVTILRDNNEYWRGEIKEVKVSLDKTKSVYCLEDLSWLADEFLIPVSITGETYAQRFQAAINAYNANRPAERQFVAGYLTNVAVSAICKWETQYDWSILDSLRNCICKDTGNIRVRRVKEAGQIKRYIDIVRLADYGVQANQPIVFGVNLLDYVKKMDMGNFTNALTPYGAETETELYTEYNTRIAGTPIEDAVSIAKYGRHAKAVIFEGVTDVNSLNSLAQAYLTRYSQPQITMEIKALDLAEISNNSHYEIGDSIHIIAEPYNIDQWIYLTKRNIDLQNVGNNNITLSSYISRGNTLVQQSIQTTDAVKDLPSKSSILDAAKRNSLNMLLDETQGGHIVYEYHETDGKADYIEAINICNQPTINASTSRWRWSYNGLGFLKRNSTADPWPTSSIPIALTNNGEINANSILTGTLDADQVTVHGKIEATSGYIGDPSQGWDIGSKSIYNGITSIDDTVNSGTYVGVDGIKFRKSPFEQDPSAETRISKLGIYTDLGLTARGPISGSGGYFNNVFSDKYYANNIEGVSGTIAWVDENQRKAFGLGVTNGIVTYINESSY